MSARQRAITEHELLCDLEFALRMHLVKGHEYPWPVVQDALTRLDVFRGLKNG